jgi:hypothetical protein
LRDKGYFSAKKFGLPPHRISNPAHVSALQPDALQDGVCGKNPAATMFPRQVRKNENINWLQYHSISIQTILLQISMITMLG